MASKKFSQIYTYGNPYEHIEEFDSIEDVVKRFKDHLSSVGVNDLVVTPISDGVTWVFSWDKDSKKCIVSEVL